VGKERIKSSEESLEEEKERLVKVNPRMTLRGLPQTHSKIWKFFISQK